MNKAQAATVIQTLGRRAKQDRLSLEWGSAVGGQYAFLKDTRLSEITAHTDDFGMQWTELFDDYRHDRYKHLEQFMRLGIAPADLAGKSVLDGGMGLGRLSEIALGAADLVVGCDLSAAVHTAARFIDHDRFVPVQASIADLPFTDGAFDVVFSWGVVHHCPDPLAALDEMWRVLKPGGTMAVWVYDNSPAYRRRSFINWHLKDFDRHDMLELANGLTAVAHTLQLTSDNVMRMLAGELCFSVKGSKEYTRHILYDGLGPDFHHLITKEAFSAWAATKGVGVNFREAMPLTAIFAKPL